jgi:hypothetical protein
MIKPTRRLFLRGLVAAPAVIAADRLMRVRGIILPSDIDWPDLHWLSADMVNIRLAYRLTHEAIDKNLKNLYDGTDTYCRMTKEYIAVVNILRERGFS